MDPVRNTTEGAATPPHRSDPLDVHSRTIQNLLHGDWLMGDGVWDVSSLWILRPDEWHSTWISWLPDGSHLGWYVNLQQPLRRTPIGFEAMDLMLDVVVEPDLSWRWKDHAEFDEIVQRGLFDGALAERVLAEAGVRVIADIEHARSPFDEPWPSWRPDPGWGRPALQDEWEFVDRMTGHREEVGRVMADPSNGERERWVDDGSPLAPR